MKNEETIKTEILLQFSKHGIPLYKNNSGVLYNEDGRPVRYGLGNDSEKLCAVRKSSDLIGVFPVTITPAMVGKTIGVFLAIETKREGWRYSLNSQHERAQANFINSLLTHGAIAGFANSVDQAWLLIREWLER